MIQRTVKSHPLIVITSIQHARDRCPPLMYFEGMCVSPHHSFTYPRRMKIFALLIAVTIVSTSVATAQANERIPVLIVDGFSNHDWEQTTAVTKWILESSGLFTVDVTTIPTDSTARQAWTLNAEP